MTRIVLNSFNRFCNYRMIPPACGLSKHVIEQLMEKLVLGHYAQRHYAQGHYAQGNYAQTEITPKEIRLFKENSSDFFQVII